VTEKTSTENVNTRGWKMQEHICSGRKWRYGKGKKGLPTAFKDDAKASKCIRCVPCLPLLPPSDIDSALTDLETFLAVL